MIDINWTPPRRELRVFGVGLFVFGALVAGLVYRETGGLLVPTAIAGTAAVVAMIGWFFPALLRWIYVPWMLAVFPIGWAVSHVLLAAVFYLVFTPIGLIMRMCGYDPMQRRLDPAARSYWVPRRRETGTRRYFRQF